MVLWWYLAPDGGGGGRRRRRLRRRDAVVVAALLVGTSALLRQYWPSSRAGVRDRLLRLAVYLPAPRCPARSSACCTRSSRRARTEAVRHAHPRSRSSSCPPRHGRLRQERLHLQPADSYFIGPGVRCHRSPLRRRRRRCPPTLSHVVQLIFFMNFLRRHVRARPALEAVRREREVG